eukprot:evm.model.scf_1767.1 EVM.evm.TU.scf_1767.1   scf_1767:4100-6108(+)
MSLFATAWAHCALHAHMLASCSRHPFVCCAMALLVLLKVWHWCCVSLMDEGANTTEAHEDGPVYHPGVCILSLGASTVLNFWRKEAPGGSRSLDPEMSVLLMPRSLLVFLDDAYADCLHGIDEVVEDRLDPSICNLAVCGMETGMRLPRVGERVSLTVRRVKRVQRNLIKLA